MSVRLEFSSECFKCGRNIKSIKIFPRKNYERFAKDFILKCGYCGNSIKEPPYTIVEVKFFIKGNTLFVRIGSIVRELAVLDEDNIAFHLNGISEFLGKCSIEFNSYKILEAFMSNGEIVLDVDEKIIKQVNKKVMKNV